MHGSAITSPESAVKNKTSICHSLKPTLFSDLDIRIRSPHYSYSNSQC